MHYRGLLQPELGHDVIAHGAHPEEAAEDEVVRERGLRHADEAPPRNMRRRERPHKQQDVDERLRGHDAKHHLPVHVLQIRRFHSVLCICSIQRIPVSALGR